jgi:hypothetical protein
MEDVLVKLNAGLVWQKMYLTRTGLFLLTKCTRKKLVKCYILSIALYGAETWDTLGSRSETPGKF